MTLDLAAAGFVWTYPAVVADLTDGDTVKCDLRLSYDLQLNRIPVRVQGINAPELNTPAGKQALAYAQQLLPVGTAVLLKHSGHDKYGRFLAAIYLPDGSSFGDLMVASGNAVPFMTN